MSGRPPFDDPGWNELLHQLEEALDEAGIEGEQTRAAVRDGLRAALESLGKLAGWSEPRHDGPEVEVVEGGRADDDPEPTGPRPDLRVAEPMPEEDESPPEETPPSPRPDVRVRLLRRADLDTARRLRGSIRLSAAGECQTIFRGAQPRAYRIGCTHGALCVHLDGLPTETVREGQTLDVEARFVRVEAAGEPPFEGRYRRLE